MTIDRDILLNTLQKCLPGVESGASTVDGADAFYFTNDTIYAQSSVIAVSVPFAPIGWNFGVKAVEFYNLIKRFSGSIDINLKDNKIIVKAGKAKATLAILDNFIEDELSGITGWLNLPSNFNDALYNAFIPSNKTNFSGTYIVDNNMYSTDRIKLNHCILNGDYFDSIWINDTVAKTVIKFGDFTQYKNASGFIYFKNDDGLILRAKKLNAEQYPITQIKKYFSLIENLDNRLPFPDDLVDAVNRATPLSDTSNKMTVVELTFSDEGITVSASRTSGEYVETVGWSEPDLWDGEPVTIKIDANHLIYGIKHGSYFRIFEMERSGEKIKTMVIYSDNSEHIIMTVQE